MAALPHTPDPGRPEDIAPSRQSQYPDPESSGITHAAWLPAGPTYGADISITSSFQSHGHETFSLGDSRTEFESSSARRRSQSRELSEESDFLGELSDG